MKTSDVLADGFNRIGESVAAVADGLGPAELNRRPLGKGNSIAWLLWHIGRVQDHQIAEAAGAEQVWSAQGFVDRFGFPLRRGDTGYGHSPEQVSAVRVDSGHLLVEYNRAVLEQTLSFVRALEETDLDRIVDQRWDPPVTLGVRLVSILGDCLMHAGQAEYVRGLPPE